MTYQRDIGKLGEDMACIFLTESGFTILERNFRTKFGEIDVIVLQKADDVRLRPVGATDVTVFIEVKTRTSSTFGTPEEAFDLRKRRRFERAVKCYLSDHHEVRDWRVDFIGITLDRAGRMIYREHIRDVASSE